MTAAHDGRDRAQRLQADAYFQKPLDFDRLLGAVREARTLSRAAPQRRIRSTFASASARTCGSSGLPRCASKPAAKACCTLCGSVIAGERDGRNASKRRGQRAHATHQRIAVLARHGDVGQQHVRPPGGQDLHRLLGAPRSAHRHSIHQQHRRHQFLRRLVVVHGEYAAATQRRRARDGASVLRTAGRQAHGEAGAKARAVAAGGDRAAVRFDDAADEREAEAEPARCARAARILTKRLEEVRQHGRRDSRARCRAPSSSYRQGLRRP